MAKHSFLSTGLILLGLILAACSQPTPTPPPADTPVPPAAGESLEARAQAFVEQLAAAEFEAAVAQFDSAMTDALPADKLREVWVSLNTQVGRYQGQAGTRAETQSPYEIIYVVCEFGDTYLDAKVVYNRAGQIAGLFFVPSQGPDAQPQGYVAPDYADLDAIQEVDVTVGEGEWALPGTLTLPAGTGPFPAVVLVHGSGPNDRDESIGPNKPFRDLAWGLATRGVAVLRYDKRTLVHGAQMADLDITVKEETLDDALAAVALLRSRPEVDAERVFLLGHSLGAMLSPRIGAQDPGLAGLVVMAGNARPLEDLVLTQVRYLFELNGSLSADEQAQLAELEAQVARVKDPNLSPDTPAEELPLGIPAGYWLDLRGYDPLAVAAELEMPLLILQGGRDYQVTTVDFEAWGAALAGRPKVSLQLYPALNHLFMEGEGPGTPDEYQRPGHVAAVVIDDLVRFIEQH